MFLFRFSNFRYFVLTSITVDTTVSRFFLFFLSQMGEEGLKLAKGVERVMRSIESYQWMWEFIDDEELMDEVHQVGS